MLPRELRVFPDKMCLPKGRGSQEAPEESREALRHSHGTDESAILLLSIALAFIGKAGRQRAAEARAEHLGERAERTRTEASV